LEVTKITRHTVPNFLNHQQPIVRPVFIQKLCYKLPSAETFTFIQAFDRNLVFFTEWRHVDRQCQA